MFPFLIFLLGVVLAFLIPGTNILYKLRLPLFSKLVLGTAVGIVFWVIQAYVFGLAGARWFSYIYLLENIVVFAWLSRRGTFQFKIPTLKIDKLAVLIVIIGTFLNLSAVWFIGIKNAQGLYFCCRGVPDAIYHLSLTNEIVKNFPPFEPGMVGIPVKNYHYLSNLLSAEFARIFNLDFIRVQFQYMSLLAALLLGGSAMVLGQVLGLNRVITRWFLVFLYGSGDIIYLLLLARNKGINFDVTIMDDASKLLAGPPRAYSIVLLLSAICLLAIFIRKRSLYAGIISAVVIGVLIGFKVYTGIFALVGIGALGFYYLLRREFRLLVIPLIAVIISAFYYLPNAKDAGGLYFNGLWRFENFMQHKDLAISKLDYLRLEAISAKNYLAVAALEVLFILIYLLTLFGTVVLGLFQNRKSLRLLPLELNIFLISAIAVSVIAGSFFYQKTGGANTVQFLITVFIVGALYASVAIFYWTRNLARPLKYIVFLVICVMTIARPVYEVANNFLFVAKGSGYVVNNGQLEAFKFLKNQTPTDSIVVVEPWMAEDEPFMYVTFLTNRKLFLSGAGVLRDHGQDTASREADNWLIFTSASESEVLGVLHKNGIDYIYVPAGVNLNFNSSSVNSIFKNQSATIFGVN